MVIAVGYATGWTGPSQIEPQDWAPAHEMEERRFPHIRAVLASRQPMYQQDQRACLDRRGWHFKGTHKTVATAVRSWELQKRGAARQRLSTREPVISQRLKVTTPPRRPVPEVENLSAVLPDEI